MRRRIISIIDQVSGLLFVAGAVVVLGLLQGAQWLARLKRNPGAIELAGILFMTGFMVLVIFAVRRRQTDVWISAAQVMLAIVGSNLLAVALVWPFLSSELPVSLAATAWTGLADGITGSLVGLPLGAAGLWLSRRWGTESGVTERRARNGSRHAGAAPASTDGRSELDVTRPGVGQSGS